jgi:hypothetical protein
MPAMIEAQKQLEKLANNMMQNLKQWLMNIMRN